MSSKENIILIYPQKNTRLFGIPFGIAYIGAVLRDSGYKVSIVDMRYEDEKVLFSKLRELSPDILGFYSSSEIAPYVVSLASRIKEEFNDTVMIAGGPHATIDPHYFLRSNFDIAVKGEGEITIKEAVKAIRQKSDLKDIRGISYRSNGNIFDNPPREFIENMDDLPFPAFDLFPHMEDTLWEGFTWTNLHPFTHVILSRGCPYQCAFCQPTLSMIFGKKVRRMSPHRAIELLTFLKQKYNIKEMLFEDDLLLSGTWKNWLIELTDLIIEHNLNIRWLAQARANNIDKDILIRAKKAGCYMVMCGVESGSQKTLDFYNKAITPENIRSFFKLCKDLELMSVAQIIFGAPEESLEDAGATIDLMREVQPDIIWAAPLTPYPGTYLTEWLTKHNIKFETDLTKVDRGMRRRKIDSVMSDGQILNARLKIDQQAAVLKKVIFKSYYRKAYLEKINNLTANGRYVELFKFLYWTFRLAVTNPLRQLYFKCYDYVIFKGRKGRHPHSHCGHRCLSYL